MDKLLPSATVRQWLFHACIELEAPPEIVPGSSLTPVPIFVAYREIVQMRFAAYKKTVDALARAIKVLAQDPAPPLGELSDALEAARKASSALDLAAFRNELDREKRHIDERLDQALSARRETLIKAAAQHNFPYRRFSDYDHLGPFKLSYKGIAVHLELGSERVVTLQEPNGARLFDLVREQAALLEREPFTRETFFQSLKDALRLARALGYDQDGRVPVRLLHPCVVLVRQGRSEAFLKKPEGRTVQDYSLVQFLYDLARFGRDGWRHGDDLLRTQTPNMATISQGKTLMLPNLDAQEGTSHRIAVLWIEKREG